MSYNKALHAIGMDGKLYDMNKLWDDVYLQEAFMLIVNEMINEVIVSHKQMALLESRGKVIRMNESQLCSIIHTIVNKLIA